jgi:N-acetylglucosamine kinase-like BadF-type ATPase
MDYLLALEGGGTRSQAALVDRGGALLGVGCARDVNTNFTTPEAAREAVRAAVGDALSAAQIDPSRVLVFASALVGPRFGRETFADLIPNAVYHYYGEGEVVFARAGIYRPDGVALIAATGATAWACRAGDGRTISFGGWGSLLGDEGSAYALGVMLLRAAGRAWEGRDPRSTRIPQALAAHFGFDPADFRAGMVQRAYHPSLTRAEIAALAPIASRLAAEGDEMAIGLVNRAANDLAALALHAAQTLFDRDDDFNLVIAGGMTRAGESILAPIRRAFRQAFPRVEPRVGAEDPALALANLARTRLGIL